MGHDVIVDRYARLYEIPFQIRKRGTNILCICLSYQGAKSGCFNHFVTNDYTLTWHSFNAKSLWVNSLLSYIRQIRKICRDFKPDILLGSSDCLHVIITAITAKLTYTPYIVDLYDNYASFGMAKIPGLLSLYHWALKNAHGIVCVSEPLAMLIRQQYHHNNVLTLESTINNSDFYPQKQYAARVALNLPTTASIIGVAGALNSNRGITLLYDSFLHLAEQYADLHLILAGPTDANTPIPTHDRIHYLGLLPHKDIVVFYNALDLAIVCMRNTEFGRYAFPQKTYEILACKTPILAANIGSLAQTFKDYPQCLYEVDNQYDLQVKIKNLLQRPLKINIPIPTWQDQAATLLMWLQRTIKI